MDKPAERRQGRLETDDGHRLWWAEGGDPRGVPVLVIHGGPGGHSRAEPLAWLADQPVRWVCWDQRGCGQSEPRGSREGNTLADLVADMDRLREHLGLERVALMAGSWGAVLALEFARRWPEAVAGLMLRSSFLGSADEVASFFAPWDEWLGDAGRQWLASGEKGAASALSRPGALALIGDTGKVPLPLAWAWERFEDAQALAGGVRGRGVRFEPPRAPSALEGVDPAALEIRAHYLLNDCFLPVDALQGWGDALRDVDVGPVALVHGEADATCDPANTHWLAGLWPDVLVNRVPDAGHRMSDPRLAPLLRETAQRWAGALCARW